MNYEIQSPVSRPRSSGQVTAGDEHEIDDEYNFHDSSFRRHYQLNLKESGKPYEYYEDAYRFGYELAEESSTDDWSRVEAEAERHWMTQHSTSWQEARQAIAYGWQESRNPEALRVHHQGEYGDFENQYREHYTGIFADAPGTYEDHAFAYRFGHGIATDPEFHNLTWEETEKYARERWSGEYAEHEWDDYRDSIYYAWGAVRMGV